MNYVRRCSRVCAPAGVCVCVPRLKALKWEHCKTLSNKLSHYGTRCNEMR